MVKPSTGKIIVISGNEIVLGGGGGGGGGAEGQKCFTIFIRTPLSSWNVDVWSG